MIISIPISEISSYEKFDRSPNLKEKQFSGTFCQNVLKDVIKNGFINPLLVMPKNKHGKYRILIGHNRFLVAKYLKYESINCIVLDLKPSNPKAIKAAKAKYYTKTIVDP